MQNMKNTMAFARSALCVVLCVGAAFAGIACGSQLMPDDDGTEGAGRDGEKEDDTANGRTAFVLDEDFSVKDEAGGSPSIAIERKSALSHAHGMICEGGYTVLIDGNRHWLAMPPVTDFRLACDYLLYLYKLEFGLGYDIHFRRDSAKGGGHRLRVWWDEHEHNLHVFLDEKEVFTGGKLPESLDDLRLVLDVKGTKGVLETVGERISFDIPGEVTAGKVAFDMPYSGSNQITLKRIRLTSGTAPAVTHVKDWKFVLSDEKGMVEPPVYEVALDRYATGESRVTVKRAMADAFAFLSPALTSDAPFTVASKSADRIVLRVATEKDTALFFKFKR